MFTALDFVGMNHVPKTCNHSLEQLAEQIDFESLTRKKFGFGVKIFREI